MGLEVESTKNTLLEKNPAGKWPQLLKELWLVNSINAALPEITYQLKELGGFLEERKTILNSLAPEERAKVSAVLAKNICPLMEFAAVWERVRGQIGELLPKQ